MCFQTLPSTLPQGLHQHQLSCESRPFLMLNNSDKNAYFPATLQQQQQQQQQQQLLQQQKQQQQQQQLVYNDSQQQLSSIGSQWSSTVYPLSSFGQQQLIPTFKTKSVPLQSHKSHKSGDAFLSNVHLRTDSRIKDYENQPVSIRLNGDYEFPMNCVTSHSSSCSNRNNVYEVPYSHLFRSQFSPEDEWTVNLVNPANPVNPAGLVPKLRPQPLGGSTTVSSHSIPVQVVASNNPMQMNFQDYESCYD
jgi:type II secretory pathway pseudopilin PulG